MRKPTFFITAAFYLFLSAGGVTFAQNAVIDQDQALIVKDIIIEIPSDHPSSKKLFEIAENLIYLEKSEPFSQERFEDSIEALRISKKFSEIHVDSEQSGEDIILKFSFVPFRYIKRVDISGEDPVFEQKILNQMTFYTGDAFVKEDLKEQEILIRKLFLKEGFLDPKVEVEAAVDPSDGAVVIDIDIETGDYLKLGEIRFSGNSAFGSGRLKLKMKTWRDSFVPGRRGRFIEKDLKEDIKYLTEFYHSKQYPDAVVEYKLSKDMKNLNAFVDVVIQEGPYYEIDFEGNEEFWDFTLKRDLVIFAEGNTHDLGLRKSVRKMKERYREKGYLETKIEVVEKDDGGAAKREDRPGVRKIKFAIQEGPRSIVTSVNVSGNSQFDEEKIFDVMLTREPGIFHSGSYAPEILETDANAIKTLYAQEGYTETEVLTNVKFSEANTKVDVAVEIQEGPRTMAGDVEIHGVTVISEQEAKESISLKTGEPFRRYMLKSDENSLSGLISSRGRPHVKVNGRVNFSDDKSKAAIDYVVEEGPSVKMGQIYYSGNFRTEESVVAREVEMEPGEPFSLQKILEAQRVIRDMEIFNSVKFKSIGLKEKAETLHLFVEMQERKPYYFQAGLGYQSDIGAYADMKLGDRNFLGRNKHLWIGGSLSQIGYRAEAWYSEPRFLGSRIQTNVGLFTEKKEEFNKNFGIKLYGASVGFSRQWTNYLSTGLALRYEKREQFEVDSKNIEDSEPIDQDEFRPRNLLVATPSIAFDTRDSVVRPREGLYSLASADISQGLDNDLDSFIKYNLDSRVFWTPEAIPRLTLALLGRVGYIDPLGNITDIPDDQLFFLGGTNDVRGYKENLLLFDEQDDPVGGRFSAVGSVEFRFDLGRNFELTAFFDAGRVKNTEIRVRDDDWRSSAGIGLRYITPIGPVGLLYGYKIDRRNGESPGRFHFSLGYTF